ncbi:MAG TPA: hypothetical protein VMQ65_07955 [Candidatus Limnocylindria bacterium]|nr:hypothetical protein [Candidatus Limnocylindria bacterium]
MTYNEQERDLHDDTAPENEEGGAEAVGAGAGDQMEEETEEDDTLTPPTNENPIR